MEYALIHCFADERGSFGYSILVDENTYNHFKSMLEGQAPQNPIGFIPLDENLVDGYLSFRPAVDRFYEEIDNNCSILYLFIVDENQVKFVTQEEWSNLERTKKITDKLNQERIRKLAGL
jgi:hypothetical protein